MGVNQVRYNTLEGEEFLVDMTDATVTPETLAKDVTAYDANGDLITGTMEGNDATLLRSGFCGKTEADEVYYKFYDDGTLIISGKGEICEGIMGGSGTPWLSLEDTDFYLEITNLIIGDGITVISGYTFGECENLESVVIADSVINVEKQAFAYCKKLKDVKLSENITTIGDYAFENCENISHIELPKNITYIGNGAFVNCKSLTNIIIPDSVTSMGYGIFSGCNHLESVILSNGITNVGSSMFFDCTNLKSIVIPDSVVDINYSAFSGCESLTKIVLSSGLSVILDQMFFGCTSLKEIFIPKSVTKICSESFNDKEQWGYGAVPLEKIYYSGTKAEWDSIVVEDGNEALLNATLYCEYDPNADTVDGWHVDVRSDDSEPEGITKPTLTFYYEVG